MRQLQQVQNVDLKALQLSQEMLSDLDRLHLLYELVAATGSQADLSETVDLYNGIIERLRSDGSTVLSAQELEQLRVELEAYNRAASSEARSASRAKQPVGAAPTLSQGTEELFARLRRYFDAIALNTRDNLASALEVAQSSQRDSFAIASFILLATALVSAGLAFVVAWRTAIPLLKLSQAALRIGEGDLTQNVEATSRDEVGQLARSFQSMVERLRELVSTLQATSGEMASAAGELEENTRAQTAVVESQASGVAETTTTTRELEQTSSVTAERAAAVLDVAQRAARMSASGEQAAERSALELRSIRGSVDGIVTHSLLLQDQVRQIADIVETVRDLSTQSHVLSLNASIEAAKAGRAGVSFAVVAQEVRALAEQSGQGAASIAQMVERILTAVQTTQEITARGTSSLEESLGQIETSAVSLREIGGIVQETSDAALQIASAVRQQSHGIAQIAAAMRDIDRGMAATMDWIRALQQSAERIARTASRIASVAAEFKL
jgi:methyl-accepting chemotaxis protein